jgi:hypothetical protein
MIVGKLNGSIVPIVVRTGNTNLTQISSLELDDESGIAFMSAANPVNSQEMNGTYIGADSNFKFTATTIDNSNGGFINILGQQPESGFTLKYGLTSNGSIGVQTTDTVPQSGYMVGVGGLYATLIQGTTNGGVISSSLPAALPATNATTTTLTPYFGIGALMGNP